MKILLIRFSSIGDIIITTPILRSLRERFPSAQIDYLTKKEFTPLLAGSAELSSVIGYDKSSMSLRSLKKKLKAQSYDLLIDLHNSLRSRVLRFGLASKIFVYSKPYYRRLLLTKFGINLLQAAKPIYRRYYHACRGLDLQEHRGYFINYSPADAQSVARYFTDEKPLLVSLSAAHRTKKWQVAKFAQLIDRLQPQKVIILGGNKEKKEASELKKLCSQSAQVLDLSGKLDLLQTAALMKNSRLLLCHDSGLLHLAQSQSLACVAIFGCTTQELGFFPINNNSRVVQVDLACRPCTAKGLTACPRKHFRCMRDISVEMVLKQVRELL